VAEESKRFVNERQKLFSKISEYGIDIGVMWLRDARTPPWKLHGVYADS
jgi:hypothetical protein